MKTIAAILLLALFLATGCSHASDVRLASSTGKDIVDVLMDALEGPMGNAATRCYLSDDLEARAACMEPWLKAASAVDAVQDALDALDHTGAAMELVDDNAMGTINCVGAAIASALRALEDVGVRPKSQALQVWSKYFGMLGTMCEYSSDGYVGRGSAEGES